MSEDVEKVSTHPPVRTKQVGIVGLRQSAGYVFEEFLPELRWPKAGKVYQQMADNDPVVGAILYLAEMLIRGAEWRVDPASSSAEDSEAAEFLDGCMNDMEESWAATITEILSMLTYGWSFHEILYKVRRGPKETNPKFKSRFTDGKFGWRGFPIRSQSSWEKWIFDDETGELVAFQQRPEPTYKLYTIPMTKGLLFRTRVSRGNPEGRSLLRNAYRPYYFKQRFEEIEGIGIERDLAGLPVLKTPEDLDLWDDEDPEMVKLRHQAETLVSSIRRDSQEGIILPAGWELSLLSSGSTRTINIGDVIERYDSRIAITMLSDIVLIGNGSKAGSFAMADVKQSMLSNALQAQLYNIADVFNQNAVPQLFQINNWDLDDYPRIVPGQINQPSLKEVAVMLRAMGLDLTKDLDLNNFVRGLMSMPQITQEEFDEIYTEPPIEFGSDNDISPLSTQGVTETGNAPQRSSSDPDDSSQKVFEQNETTRMTGEEAYL